MDLKQWKRYAESQKTAIRALHDFLTDETLQTVGSRVAKNRMNAAYQKLLSARARDKDELRARLFRTGLRFEADIEKFPDEIFDDAPGQ